MAEQSAVPLYMARQGLDPAPEAVALRESGGLAKVPVTLGSGEAWLVTQYADVRQVLSDPSRFSNTLMGGAAERAAAAGISPETLARRRKGQLLAFDPPEHTHLRRMLTPEFTMRRMRRLDPRIAEIVEQHLDLLEQAGPGADLVENFALPIPSMVICELLGVPYGDRSEFQDRTSRMTDTSLPTEERSRLSQESHAYMAKLVARAQAAPGDDILGMLVTQHGDELDADALTNIAGLLLTAGHETTANMLAVGTLALLTHPEEEARLRATLYNPAQVERAMEELLRFLSVAHSGIPRTATQDVEIGGQTIRAGEQVLFALAPANRDPRFIDDPDRLDLARDPRPHIAFGHGAHHCLGAPLARAEMRIAFPALLRRFPDLALAVPADEIRFRPHHVVYGVQSLPVTWSRTSH
ncbi:cytochrome P450 [Streptosporangium sp. 'caverna']|uniref:cytochrome P450 n=1 Tax=Streptosporangium sp. 'caverna' TaxID=2202249 RepID=UPI000D7D7CBD|nr:cytochrome P450 [Streptosporangium sp. 'caverna']AWS43587.1 cytochrome P450 [Streptosporangium sp. 'caverna']